MKRKLLKLVRRVEGPKLHVCCSRPLSCFHSPLPPRQKFLHVNQAKSCFAFQDLPSAKIFLPPCKQPLKWRRAKETLLLRSGLANEVLLCSLCSFVLSSNYDFMDITFFGSGIRNPGSLGTIEFFQYLESQIQQEQYMRTNLLLLTNNVWCINFNETCAMQVMYATVCYLRLNQ